MGRAGRFVLGMLAASAAQAQEPAAESSRFELGARYWVGTGSTKRSHDASSFTPIALNPTSTLVYSDLDANTFEVYARKAFGERGGFVKGNLGLGTINTGTFTDQDFFRNNAGVPVMTQTISAVSGKLQYFTVDLGTEVVQRGNSRFTAFVGVQQWAEKLDGHGFSDSFGPASLPDSALVISNDLTWKSFRFGGEWRAVRGRTRFNAEAALVPYAKYRNEDSHYLRQSPSDLGPAPNVIATGKGWGYQFEAEIRRAYPDLWGTEFAVGYRYWRMEATSGTQSQAGLVFPVTDLVSERHGFTFTASKSW